MTDVLVVGSGIGGLTAAAILARRGLEVTVLEANYLPGGCCSSYWRKGYIFESGATTLMGFDPGQPLDLVQRALGQELALPKTELDPAMTVWLDGQQVLRPKSLEAWIAQAQQAFGQPREQERFWRHTAALADWVWRVSGRNLRFPPRSVADLLALAAANPPTDYPRLRHAFRTVTQVLAQYGLNENRPFRRFLDEQLLITAQNTADRVPYLFAAPALCYTLSTNYNLPGGMIGLSQALLAVLAQHGGQAYVRRAVKQLKRMKDHWQVTDGQGQVQQARHVLSNLPVWNLAPLLADSPAQRHLSRAAAGLTHYWGAYTMSLAVKDIFPAGASLHHQLILPAGQALPITGSHSVFVSMSAPDDHLRTTAGTRVLALSTHARQPQQWFEMDGRYEASRQQVTQHMLSTLRQAWPALTEDSILYQTDSTPVAWAKWTLRHQGTVGGLPQDVARPLWRWLGAATADPRLFLCGDTVYPGQGVPGVALGGLIAAQRILRRMARQKS